MTEQRRCDRKNDGERKACYDAIRQCMTKELHAYYERHPEWILDERSQEKIAMLMRVLSRQLQVLDCYDLCKRHDVNVNP